VAPGTPSPAAMPDDLLESRLWVPRPRSEVFWFFADPARVTVLSPPRLRLRLLTPDVRPGPFAVVEYRLRWFGLPLRWRSFIREWDPPARFVVVQVAGPMNRWEHRHLFRAERGGTWVEDRITYRLPGGPLGRLAHRLLVGRHLRELWAYRRRRIAELLAPVYDEPPR
jgi:ligand-binding SRPBCC domain-containing protein